MQSKPPGPRRLSPEARRELIVAEAVRYFAEVGFSGPTRDLARRAGVTQPLLYKYFATKADLTEAVFERVYLDRLDPSWPAMLTDRSRAAADAARGILPRLHARHIHLRMDADLHVRRACRR